jgi:predicted Zn-dependent protease with MMP-like domain
MTLEEFEQLVAEEFPRAIEDKFKGKIKNVAFLVEDEPSLALRRAERLPPNVTLLGHYRGIPHTSRGDYYGVGGTLPDTITLFRIPIENAALGLLERQKATQERDQHAKESQTWPSGPERSLLRADPAYEQLVRQVIRDTIWHEVAHHFGMNEFEVRSKEAKRQK